MLVAQASASESIADVLPSLIGVLPSQQRHTNLFTGLRGLRLPITLLVKSRISVRH
jgi:hypothetical protein